jgi:hypothetical protein
VIQRRFIRWQTTPYFAETAKGRLLAVPGKKEKRASDFPPEFTMRACFRSQSAWSSRFDFPPEFNCVWVGWLEAAFRSAGGVAERPKNA